jgi:hypothetical protein
MLAADARKELRLMMQYWLGDSSDRTYEHNESYIGGEFLSIEPVTVTVKIMNDIVMVQ